MILIALLLLSIVESIRRYGWIAGLLRHKGLQTLIMYVVMLALGIVVMLTAYELAGNKGTVTVVILSWIGYFLYEKRVSSKPDGD